MTLLQELPLQMKMIKIYNGLMMPFNLHGVAYTLCLYHLLIWSYCLISYTIFLKIMFLHFSHNRKTNNFYGNHL